MANTTYTEVKTVFESMPMSKYILNDNLIRCWFFRALGDYELELTSLGFNSEIDEFSTKLTIYQINTLALLMYTYYLSRELSRVEKLNGIVGKDISMTGMDATKRVTLSDLKLQIEKVETMINKQKQHCFA